MFKFQQFRRNRERAYNSNIPENDVEVGETYLESLVNSSCDVIALNKELLRIVIRLKSHKRLRHQPVTNRNGTGKAHHNTLQHLIAHRWKHRVVPLLAELPANGTRRHHKGQKTKDSQLLFKCG